MKQIALIIAAHPDDEVLGCGGTIARHISEGDNVAVLFLSDGVSSREKPNQSIEERNKSAFEACKILGADTPLFLNFPDNKMDALPLLEIVLALEKII
ncbi:MAG: PIG-L family deacetylase, partial [Deltaproteobacteria bacterium]|nr:PIG-L family deacetylase [Deltaproteobacteria bacterium]